MNEQKKPIRGNTKRDSTRILSNLSNNSRVVPARAKSTSSRNKIFASLAGILVLAGATIWFLQRPGISTSTPSLATTSVNPHADIPAQTASDIPALALPALPESQAAQIENLPNTDDTSKTGVTLQNTTPIEPFAALTENTARSEKNNDDEPVKTKAAKADQKSNAPNTVKKAHISRAKKTEDDPDVTLLAALIQSTKPSSSTKKTAPQKTPAVAERLKRCRQLGKEEAVRCSQKVCEGQVGKNLACQQLD